MQSDSFEFTVRMGLTGMKPGVHTGLAMFERSASGLEITLSGSERRLSYFHLPDVAPGPLILQNIIQLRMCVEGDKTRYFYNLDDVESFQPLGATTPIGVRLSWWKGTRPALFAYITENTDPVFIDIDWVHDQPVGSNPW